MEFLRVELIFFKATEYETAEEIERETADFVLFNIAKYMIKQIQNSILIQKSELSLRKLIADIFLCYLKKF